MSAVDMSQAALDKLGSTVASLKPQEAFVSWANAMH